MRLRSLKWVPAWGLAVVAILEPLGLAGCSGEKVVAYQPITDPAQLYWRLELDHPAVTLAAVASYDTLRLTATPFDARGDTLKGLPAPIFHLNNPNDSSAVKVSADGLVTARQPVTGVLVVAEMAAAGNVRHADTAVVNVTGAAPAAPLDKLTLDIAGPDSAIWAIPGRSLFRNQGVAGDSIFVLPTFVYAFFGRFAFPPSRYDLPQYVSAQDAAGNPMPVGENGLSVEYRSLDPEIVAAAIGGDRWGGQMYPVGVGKARLVARATAYGVTRSDTLTVTVTPPEFTGIGFRSKPGTTSLVVEGDQTIRVNGVVAWVNALDRPVDVVFDNPANAVSAPAAVCNLVPIILGFFQVPDAGSHCPTTSGNLTIPAPADAKATEIWETIQLEQFTQPGTYTYHDAQTGASGRITVTAPSW